MPLHTHPPSKSVADMKAANNRTAPTKKRAREEDASSLTRVPPAAVKPNAPMTAIEALRASADAPKRPKRPLTAYNFFFREKRQMLLDAAKKDAESHALPMKKRHPHVPPKKKIGFEQLGRVIGDLWRDIKPKELKKYKAMAEEDSRRYRMEMDLFQEQERQAMHKLGRDIRPGLGRSVETIGGDSDRGKAAMTLAALDAAPAAAEAARAKEMRESEVALHQQREQQQHVASLGAHDLQAKAVEISMKEAQTNEQLQKRMKMQAREETAVRQNVGLLPSENQMTALSMAKLSLPNASVPRNPPARGSAFMASLQGQKVGYDPALQLMAMQEQQDNAASLGRSSTSSIGGGLFSFNELLYAQQQQQTQSLMPRILSEGMGMPFFHRNTAYGIVGSGSASACARELQSHLSTRDLLSKVSTADLKEAIRSREEALSSAVSNISTEDLEEIIRNRRQAEEAKKRASSLLGPDVSGPTATLTSPAARHQLPVWSTALPSPDDRPGQQGGAQSSTTVASAKSFLDGVHASTTYNPRDWQEGAM